MAVAPIAPQTGSETIKMPRVSPRTLRRSAQVPALEPGPHLAVEEEGGTVIVPIGEGLTKIGRGFSADVRLEDPTVSRRHAIVVHEAGATDLLDDRSANGVLVNGQRVQRHRLQHGDEVVLGHVRMRFIDAT